MNTMNTMNTASLAPSTHYQADKGKAYVAIRQSDPDSLGHALNFGFFRPYIKPTDAVLDFGCGNGGLLNHLAKHAARIEGLEINPEAARIARTSGYIVYSRLAEIPATTCYDVIVTNHVLEHVRDVPGTLEHLRERLKPGGQLVAKLPIDDWREPRQRLWSASDIDHHLHTWTPRLFANTLIEAGFKVREAKVICSAWHPRLFPLMKLGLGGLAFWALAAVKRRRQLLAVGVRKP